MILSLIFGLLAIVLGVINIFSKKLDEMKRYAYVFLSMSFTAIAILDEIAYYNSEINSQDWSAVMDTIGVGFHAAFILFILVFLLNLIAMRNIRKS